MHEESDDGNVLCVLFVYACLCDAYLDMVDSMWPVLVNVYTGVNWFNVSWPWILNCGPKLY